jgi:hypothetical protein
MTQEQCQPVRKRGKEVDLPDLRQKINLLLEGRVPRGGRLRPIFTKQGIVAEELGLAPAELCKAIASGRLSTAKVPGLLRLFELDVGDWVVPETEEDRHWLRLAQESIDAFRARVRLAGGDDFSGGSGGTWDRFVVGLRGAARCTPSNPNSFKIVARDREDWLNPRPSAAKRMGPPGDAFHGGSRLPSLPVLRAGQFAKVFLDTQAALPQRNVRVDGAYVFLFQDVVIDRSRHIAPLVPFPPDSTLAMPGERVAGGGDCDTLMQVPLPRGPEQFLEIYADWGSLRSLVAIVTDRTLDEEIVVESRGRRQLQLERLDLLAARLADKQAWPEGSYTVWELQYKVEQGIDGLQR